MTVPHFYQSHPSTCGPACLRMLCGALGLALDEATLARHCNVTPYGCTLQDLIDGAQAVGLAAQLLNVFDDAAATVALSKEVPFVAMIDLSSLQGGPMFQWHFVVPLEQVGDEVRFHDPEAGPDRMTKLTDFLLAWAGAGYRGVQLWTP